VDEAALRAARRTRLGDEPDYDLVAENFDFHHYFAQVPGLLDRPRVDPVENFLEMGVTTQRSPHPDFSMANYLQRYPQHAEGPERSPYLHWLKRGRAAGEIADPSPAIEEMAHMLGLPAHEVVDRLVARRADLRTRLRTGDLGEMIDRAAEIEPLIDHARHKISRAAMLPFGNPVALQQVAAIHAAHEVADFRTARLVLVINRPRWGGGRRMEGHLAHALGQEIAPEEIVVLYTEEGGTTPEGRFPAGVREIDLASLVEGLEPEDAETVLVVLLRTFRADAIVNVNSGMLYRAMQTMGKALTASERVFLCFFCNERTPAGYWNGWSLRFFYRLFDLVEGVFTDSTFLAEELERTYRVPAAWRHRLQVLDAPVDPTLPLATAPQPSPDRRPVVFWAGRWDRQKRIGVFLEVASRMPDVDFRMWGEKVMDRNRRRGVPPNVSIEGRYDHISQVPLDEADAWLYTSGWDGVPSQLLEVGVTGLPIVGTQVGGSGAILTPEEAWPIDEDAGADAYVEGLRQVLADPVQARQRALRLRERLLAERTEKAFAEHAAGWLLVDRRERDDR
jgi:glycosyltransferase involved in cell wall biosynthesis